MTWIDRGRVREIGGDGGRERGHKQEEQIEGIMKNKNLGEKKAINQGVEKNVAPHLDFGKDTPTWKRKKGRESTKYTKTSRYLVRMLLYKDSVNVLEQDTGV